MWIRQVLLLSSICAMLISVDSNPAASYNQSSIEQPSVVSAVAPTYPPIARSARAQGDVIVEIKVDAKGNVQATKVISGHPLLQKASERAAMRWTFSPGISDSAPRTIRLTFSDGDMTLRQRDKSEPEFMTTFLPPYKVEVKWNPPIIN